MDTHPSHGQNGRPPWRLQGIDFLLISLTILAVGCWILIMLYDYLFIQPNPDTIPALSGLLIAMYVRIAVSSLLALSAFLWIMRLIPVGMRIRRGWWMVLVVVLVAGASLKEPIETLFLDHHRLTVRAFHCPLPDVPVGEVIDNLNLDSCDPVRLPWIDVQHFPDADIQPVGPWWQVTNLPGGEFQGYLSNPTVGESEMRFTVERDPTTEDVVDRRYTNAPITDGVADLTIFVVHDADVLVDIVFFEK